MRRTIIRRSRRLPPTSAIRKRPAICASASCWRTARAAAPPRDPRGRPKGSVVGTRGSRCYGVKRTSKVDGMAGDLPLDRGALPLVRSDADISATGAGGGCSLWRSQPRARPAHHGDAGASHENNRFMGPQRRAVVPDRDPRQLHPPRAASSQSTMGPNTGRDGVLLGQGARRRDQERNDHR